MKSASLALPLPAAPAKGMTREQFLQLQGAGLEMTGVAADDLLEVAGLGDLAVYADHVLGTQLRVFWGEGGSAIINRNGVDAAGGLLELTRSVVAAL